MEQVLWELAEINFRFEFQALDRRAAGVHLLNPPMIIRLLLPALLTSRLQFLLYQLQTMVLPAFHPVNALTTCLQCTCDV